MKILVVDDEPDLIESVRLGFTLQWREVDVLEAHGVTTGRVSHPRTVDVGASRAWSMSTSHSGNRFRISSSATRPSSRASAAPRQKWIPYPKARCCPIERWMSKVSPFGKRRSSRLAAPTSMRIALPAGTVCQTSAIVDVTADLIDFNVNENAWISSMLLYKLGFFGLDWDDTPWLDNKASF